MTDNIFLEKKLFQIRSMLELSLVFAEQNRYNYNSKYYVGCFLYADLNDGHTDVQCDGSIIPIILARNEYPSGDVFQSEDFCLPNFMIHAEEILMREMKKYNFTSGGVAVTHFPCDNCVRLMYENGITEIVTLGLSTPSGDRTKNQVISFCDMAGINLYDLSTGNY